jgi:hypothetical protein
VHKRVPESGVFIGYIALVAADAHAAAAKKPGQSAMRGTRRGVNGDKDGGGNNFNYLAQHKKIIAFRRAAALLLLPLLNSDTSVRYGENVGRHNIDDLFPQSEGGILPIPGQDLSPESGLRNTFGLITTKSGQDIGDIKPGHSFTINDMKNEIQKVIDDNTITKELTGPLALEASALSLSNKNADIQSVTMNI